VYTKLGNIKIYSEVTSLSFRLQCLLNNNRRATQVKRTNKEKSNCITTVYLSAERDYKMGTEYHY